MVCIKKEKNTLLVTNFSFDAWITSYGKKTGKKMTEFCRLLLYNEHHPEAYISHSTEEKKT